MNKKVMIEGSAAPVREQNFILDPSGITRVQQPTELGESLDKLNDDTLDRDTRMTGIDLRARLHHVEIPYILALDSLVSLGVLPTACLPLSRQKKRLSVSLGGGGRNDIVNIVSGKKEMDARQGMSITERLGNLFTGGNKQ